MHPFFRAVLLAGLLTMFSATGSAESVPEPDPAAGSAVAVFYGGPVSWGVGLGLLMYLVVAGWVRPQWSPGSDDAEVLLGGQPYQLQALWGTVQETRSESDPILLHLLDGKVLQISARYRDATDRPGHRLCAAGFTRRHWLPQSFVAIYNPDTERYRPQWRDLLGHTMPVHPYVAVPVILLSGAFTYGVGLLLGAAWMAWLYVRARRQAQALARWLQPRIVPAADGGG